MKLIVFSDIHGNVWALKEFFGQIKTLEYDYLVFCGDIFGYYYNQSEVLQLLSQQEKLIWLKGNHDQYFLKAYKDGRLESALIEKYGHSYQNLSKRYNMAEVELIENLQPSRNISLMGKNIGIFHGTPEDSLEGRLYPNNDIIYPDIYKKYDIVILGHTHCRMKRMVGETLVLNPGSLGQPRDGNGYSYAVLDVGNENVSFLNVLYDEENLYQQIDEMDPGLSKLKEVLERGN